ncbi:hypothetical protein ZOSMA_100G00100 [Zostera marina]|uniref:Uncharacterized protein n=1 Tax=Zostera marina TaxID=29655 RepID=A0A0K9Q6F7_ZOSMR|nr:hypothetical protein ZOSMA_100G00100 [Zostera marina]
MVGGGGRNESSRRESMDIRNLFKAETMKGLGHKAPRRELHSLRRSSDDLVSFPVHSFTRRKTTCSKRNFHSMETTLLGG